MRRGNVNCGWRWQCTIINCCFAIVSDQSTQAAAEQKLSSKGGWCFSKSSWSLQVLLNSRENTNTEPKLGKIFLCLRLAANKAPVSPCIFLAISSPVATVGPRQHAASQYRNSPNGSTFTKQNLAHNLFSALLYLKVMPRLKFLA